MVFPHKIVRTFSLDESRAAAGFPADSPLFSSLRVEGSDRSRQFHVPDSVRVKHWDLAVPVRTLGSLHLAVEDQCAA